MLPLSSIMSFESSLDSQNSAGIQSPRAAPAVCSEVKNDVIRPNDVNLVGNESGRDNVLDGDVSKTSTPFVNREDGFHKGSWKAEPTKKERKEVKKFHKVPSSKRKALKTKERQRFRPRCADAQRTEQFVPAWALAQPEPIIDSFLLTRFNWEGQEYSRSLEWWNRYMDAYTHTTSWERRNVQLNHMVRRNMRAFAAFEAHYRRVHARAARAGKAVASLTKEVKEKTANLEVTSKVSKKLERQQQRIKLLRFEQVRTGVPSKELKKLEKKARKQAPKLARAEGGPWIKSETAKGLLKNYDEWSGIINLILRETGGEEFIHAFLENNPRLKGLAEVPAKGIVRNLVTETSVIDKVLTSMGTLSALKAAWEADVTKFNRNLETMKMVEVAKILSHHASARYSTTEVFENGQWNSKTYDMTLRSLQNRIAIAMRPTKTDKASTARREDAMAAQIILQRSAYIRTTDVGRSKPQPIAMVLHGKPGVGKTFVANAMMDLYAKTMCGFKVCPDNFKYVFNGRSDFDDNYDPSARGIIFDDVGQNPDAKERSKELDSILRIVNNENLDVLRAEVTEKGLFNYGNIEIVAVTSNSPCAGCSQKAYNSPDAIFRRLNTFGFVEIWLDPEVPSTAKWTKRWRFDVYDRWESGQVYKTYPIRGQSESARECKALTFSEFIEYSMYAFVTHKAQQEALCSPSKCPHMSNPNYCYECALEEAGPEMMERCGVLPAVLQQEPESVSVEDQVADVLNLRERISRAIKRIIFTSEMTEEIDADTAAAYNEAADFIASEELPTAKPLVDLEASLLLKLHDAVSFIERQSAKNMGIAALCAVGAVIGFYHLRRTTRDQLPKAESAWTTAATGGTLLLLLQVPALRKAFGAMCSFMIEKTRDTHVGGLIHEFIDSNKAAMTLLSMWLDVLDARIASDDESPFNIDVLLMDALNFMVLCKEWQPSKLHYVGALAIAAYLCFRKREEVGVAETTLDDQTSKLAKLRAVLAFIRSLCPESWGEFTKVFVEKGYAWIFSDTVAECVKKEVSNYKADIKYIADTAHYYTVGSVRRKTRRLRLYILCGVAFLLFNIAIASGNYSFALAMAVAISGVVYWFKETETPPTMPEHFVRDGVKVAAAVLGFKALKMTTGFIQKRFLLPVAEGVIASVLSGDSTWDKPFSFSSKNRSVRSGDMASHMQRCVERVKLIAANGNTCFTHMFMVDGQICTLASHVVAEALDIGPNFMIEVDRRNYHVSRSQIVIHEESDLAFIWLPFAEIPKSCVDYLPPSASQFSGHGRRFEGDVVTNVVGISRKDFRYVDGRDKMYSMNGYVYTGYSDQGHCGMPVISNTPGQQFLVGIHVAGLRKGTTNGTCFLTRLTREAFDRAKAELTSRVAPTAAVETTPIEVRFDNPLEEAEMYTPMYSDMNPLVGSAVCAGVIAGAASGRKFKSSVTDTPFVEESLEDFGYETNPFSKPLMGTNAAHQANFIKRVGQCTIPTDDLVSAREDYELIIEHPDIKEWAMNNVRVLTDQEAVAGVLEGPLAIIDRLNLKTSPGFGYKCKTKESLMVMVDTGKQIIPVMGEQLAAEVREAEAKLRAGQSCSWVFRAAQKDEPVSVEKARSKMRIFGVGQLAALILSRKYMGAINALIQTYPFSFECALGANAHGLFWNRMAQRMIEMMKGKTDRVLAGDYSSFDLCISNEVMQQVCLFYIHVAKLVGYSQEDINVIAGLFHDIVRPVVIVKNEVWQFSGSNPSGHPLTTFVNSVANSLYYRCAFYAMNPHLKPGAFKKSVALMTFGDDSIAGVAPGVHFPHCGIQEYFAAHGIKYTLATKEEGTVEYQDLSEVDFLKRGFVFREKGWQGLKGGIWTGPLAKKAITKSLFVYMPSKAVTRSDQFTDIFRSVAIESALHGPEYFEEIAAKLRRCAERGPAYGLPEVVAPAQTWKETITNIKNVGFQPE
jgi:DNA replication protein DnaC